MASASIIVSAWACGSSTAGNDAGTDAASDVVTADVGSDVADAEAGPACDPTKPFVAPVPIAELNTAADELFARLTHDELTVYFERYPSADSGVGPSELYVASRSSVTSAFGTPTVLSSLNGGGNQFDPTVTGDNLTLYFASTRSGGAGAADLWSATRADTSSQFGNVTNLTNLNTPANEHTPYVMADGLTLYFCSEDTSANLVRATRTSTTPFATDTSGALAMVNGAGDNLAPAVSPDELTLYFASDRGGTAGPLDIWLATRASTSAAFGSVTTVMAVNTSGTDAPSWVSDDGCRLYLYSDIAGSDDIYIATKGP